jgi:hypothetical protein
MAARAGDVVSKRTAEEDYYPPQVADEKAHEMVADVDETVAVTAAATDVDECSDDEADPFIRNLNRMARLNLMSPEWIESMKKSHYEDIDVYNRAYDALENGEIESDDEAGAAEYEEWSKRLWASVDLSGLNPVGGESRGIDPVAVYPVAVNPPEEKDNDAAAAAAES